jgi:hypothetical protein
MPVRSRSPAHPNTQVRALRRFRASLEATLACPNRARSRRGAALGRTGCWGLPRTPMRGGNMTRRDFGTTRRLPSGRWQARFSAPDGSRLAVERTFATRADAASYLSAVQADLDRGSYVDPTAGSGTFTDYATTWLAQRADLRPRTADLYEGLLNRHLLPHLATVPLAQLTPAVVRRWHAGRLQAGVGRSTVAKAYPSPRRRPPRRMTGSSPRCWRRPVPGRPRPSRTQRAGTPRQAARLGCGGEASRQRSFDESVVSATACAAASRRSRPAPGRRRA